MRWVSPNTKAAALLLLLAACSVPGDPAEHEYVPPDATVTQALGAACDEARSCGAGLVCRRAAECRRSDPDAVVSPEAPGGRASDRCDDAHPCAAGLSCEPLADVAVCTRDCTADADCPEGAVCWLERGPAQSWCVRPGGLLGAACELETDCAPGLFCENRASGGYCAKACDTGAPCPAGMSAICTRLSGEFGIYCLQRCTDDREACRPDVACRKMARADEYVCFPQF
jgi:hypothetical protein